MIVLALRAQDVGTDPGAQRLGHGNRAVGLLVLLDDGGQQAAGGQAGGVEGMDVGGGLATDQAAVDMAWSRCTGQTAHAGGDEHGWRCPIWWRWLRRL